MKSRRIEDVESRPYDLSVVVPCFNEQDNLEAFYAEITSVLESMKVTYEVIVVDDGSTDGSAGLLREMACRDHRLKVVRFTRNFGQTAAMAAGFDFARGRIYVAIDADMQNDPADIPRLMAKLGEGFDVVSGWRRRRRDSFLTRRLPSVIANRLLSVVTGVRLKDYGCSLKAYRAEYIDAIGLYGEMHRFIPAYAHMAGARVAELEVNHRPRTMGSTSYGLGRVFKVLIDLMTTKFLISYSKKPGYLFGGVGTLLCLLGMASGAQVVAAKFMSGVYAHKNPFLLLAVFLFLIGVQFIMMGLIAELLVRTYHESQSKPVYLVRETVNLS